MMRSFLSPIAVGTLLLLLGSHSDAQPSCSVCDLELDLATGNELKTCYCNGIIEAEFSIIGNETWCDDQVAIYRCEDITGPDADQRRYPITFLPACTNSNSGICHNDPITNGVEACVEVDGNTVKFDQDPGLQLPFEWPIPTCTCLRVVYQRGQLTSSSPPPYDILLSGIAFEIPDETCPIPTPAPAGGEDTPPCEEPDCYRACGDVPGYEDKYEAPCKRPSEIVFEFTGHSCDEDNDCTGPNPLDPSLEFVQQESEKCTCEGDIGEIPDAGVTIVATSDFGTEEIVGVKVGMCFSIGAVIGIVDCPGDDETTGDPVGPFGRYLMNEFTPMIDGGDTTTPSFLRSRELKGGGKGGKGDCGNYFDAQTFINYGNQKTEIHTSCSQPLVVEMSTGGGTVVGLYFNEEA